MHSMFGRGLTWSKGPRLLAALCFAFVYGCKSDGAPGGGAIDGSTGDSRDATTGAGGATSQGGADASGTSGTSGGGGGKSGSGGIRQTGGASSKDGSVGSDAGSGLRDASTDGTADGGRGTGAVNWIVPFPALNKGVDAIAAYGDSVYWVTHGGVDIYKVAKGGGTPVLLDPGAPWGACCSWQRGSTLAVDATGVYFPAGDNFHNFFFSIPIDGVPDGGAGKGLAQFDPAYVQTNALALSGGMVYGAPNSDIWGVSETGSTQVHVVDSKGTKPVDPISGAPVSYAAINALTTDGTRIYYEAGGYLLSVPITGGTPTVMPPPAGTQAANAQGLYVGGSDFQIASAGGFVFTSTGTTIWRIPTGSGAATSLFGPGPYVGSEVETDGTSVYFVLAAADGQPRGVYKVRADGSSSGAPTLVVADDGMNLAAGSSGRRAIAIDATHVYDIAAGGQAIISAPK